MRKIDDGEKKRKRKRKQKKKKRKEQDRVVNSSGSKMVNFHRTEAGLT